MYSIYCICVYIYIYIYIHPAPACSSPRGSWDCGAARSSGAAAAWPGIFGAQGCGV